MRRSTRTNLVHDDTTAGEPSPAPPPEFHYDDGTIVYGDEAIAAGSAWVDGMQSHNRKALAQLKPHELARLGAWLRTRKRPTPPSRPRVVAVIVPRGARAQAAPRERRDGSSSRSSGQDPGGDDDPDPAPLRPGARS